MLSWDEMSEKEQLECTLWDAYKDAHGVRPRFMNMAAMTVEELKKEIEICCETIMQQEAQRAIDEQEAIVKFEDRVLNLMHTGTNRERVIAWLMDAEGCDGDFEYFCFTQGLPYGYFRKIA